MATSVSSGRLSFATTGGYSPLSEPLTLEGWTYCRTADATGKYIYTFETGSAAFGLTLRATSNGAGWDLSVLMTVGTSSSFCVVQTKPNQLFRATVTLTKDQLVELIECAKEALEGAQ